MRIWLISDTHFGHKKMVEFGRPIAFEEEIKTNLQKMIKPEDLLIHLGDVCFGSDAGNNPWFAYNLQCACWLVRGNHDKKSVKFYLENGWDFAADRLDLKIFGKHCCFTHEPIHWDGRYDYNYHGHLHDSQHHEGEYPFYSERHRLISMEKSGYKPVLLKQEKN